MAHMVETMAYAGETPWHGLGSKVEKGSPIETWIDEAGLTWTVEIADVAVRTGPVNGDGKATWTPAQGHRGIYRSDTGKLFHIATERYKPVQPREVLEFFRNLSDEHGMQVETCGSLREGAIVWALATNGGSIRVHGVDEIKPYLLLSTAMDGTQATRACYTTVRVVCNNTLQLSLKEDKQGAVHVRHSTAFDAEAVKARLGLLSDEMQAFADAADKLANHRMSGEEATMMLRGWFGKAKDGESDPSLFATELTTQSNNVISDAIRAMATSPGQDLVSARGTAWGVLNGITNYVDFGARARSNDNRLTSAWFGKGATIKTQAMRDLIALAA